MGYIIRRRKIEDCKSIAHVVTVAWDETYKGIVPDWFLEELKNNEVERTKRIIEKFNEDDNHQFVLEVDNEVVEFVNVVNTKDKDFENCGEIFALYIKKI